MAGGEVTGSVRVGIEFQGLAEGSLGRLHLPQPSQGNPVIVPGPRLFETQVQSLPITILCFRRVPLLQADVTKEVPSSGVAGIEFRGFLASSYGFLQVWMFEDIQELR